MKRDEKSSAAKAGDFFLCKKKNVCYNGAKMWRRYLLFGVQNRKEFLIWQRQ